MFEDAPTTVRSLVIAALWTPVVIVLWGVSIAIAFAAYRVARYGDLPSLGALAIPEGYFSIGALAVAGGVGYLYLMLANETFGSDTVDAATEQAQELRDEVTDGGEKQD